MPYPFPPELQRKIEQQMAAGGYASEDELLLDAMAALDDMHRRQEELRAEIQERLKSAGTSRSRPLDREQLHAEMRRGHGLA